MSHASFRRPLFHRQLSNALLQNSSLDTVDEDEGAHVESVTDMETDLEPFQHTDFGVNAHARDSLFYTSPIYQSSHSPICKPSQSSIYKPSQSPIYKPSQSPIYKPSQSPIYKPSQSPIYKPSQSPIYKPSQSPIYKPSQSPIYKPSQSPIYKPSQSPIYKPSQSPIYKPSQSPIYKPSQSPIYKPNQFPMCKPSQSPICKPNNKQTHGIQESADGQSSPSRSVIEFDNCSTPYFDPWDSTSERNVHHHTPYTPYTEIMDPVPSTKRKFSYVQEDSPYTKIPDPVLSTKKDGCNVWSGTPCTEIPDVRGIQRNVSCVRPETTCPEIQDSVAHTKRKPAPLPLHFPTTSAASGYDSLPFSPIHRASFKGVDGCHIFSGDVRSLPMSPAVFMSQTTSTPGPTGVRMDMSLCQSICEEDNSIFNFPECNMCRICHEDGIDEKLVSPCHCTGTMGMLHVSCLEKWLGSSNTTKCEICQFQFVIQKKARPFIWYMREPTLVKDRNRMIKDIVWTMVISCFIMMVTVLCLVFAKRLMEEDNPGPASVLILLTVCALMLYCICIVVAIRRMRKRVLVWHCEHHIIHIKQKQECNGDTSNRIFRRFPVRFSTKHRNLPVEENKLDEDNLMMSSSCIGYSVGSYKAAMFNPVTLDEPLLQDVNNNDITFLDETSPSVISLDELLEECVSYYQPPECGTTSYLINESGNLVRETGV